MEGMPRVCSSQGMIPRVPELPRCRAPIRTVGGPGVYSNVFRFCREMQYHAVRSCTLTETYSILETDPGTIYFAQLRGTPATLMWSLLSLVTGASTRKILE